MTSLQERVDLKDLFSQDLQISMPVLRVTDSLYFFFAHHVGTPRETKKCSDCFVKLLFLIKKQNNFKPKDYFLGPIDSSRFFNVPEQRWTKIKCL